MKRYCCIIIIIVLLVMLSYLQHNPIFIDHSCSAPYIGVANRDTFNIFDSIKDEEKIKILIHFSADDEQELPNLFKGKNVIYSEKKEVILAFKKYANFVQSHTDMATCTSMIYIIKNNKVICKSNITVTSNTIGLQNPIVGWSESITYKELIKVMYEFETSNSLVLLLK